MKRALLTLAAAFLLTGAAPALATQPAPLPNPDLPAVTPVTPGSGNADSPDASVSSTRACGAMRRFARRGNGSVGLKVVNLRSGKSICSLGADARRSLASNTKLFTTATALDRLGSEATFRTRVFAAGKVENGTLNGNLFLKGGGDPSFGTSAFVDSYLAGEGSEVEKLAVQVRQSGIRKITGRVFADDTVFDRLRGVQDSGYATSPWIGPLSGLSFNAGFTSASLSRFSSDPARLAARSLARALRVRGVNVRLETGLRRTPGRYLSNQVARQISPDMAWMARVTNLNSVNYWAEMLLKDLGAEILGSGTTASGVKVVRRSMAKYGVDVWPIDGSGLTYGNRSTASNVVRLLARARKLPWARDFLASLPTAGVDGTLASRMRGSEAQGRCHAKTGTLTGVTALSGYCFNQSGRQFAFSILMNDVSNVTTARAAQDRIAALIANL